MADGPRFASRKDNTALQKEIAAQGRRASPGMMQKLLAAQKRERDLLLAEMVKIRGLMPLLMKPRNGLNWSPGERSELTAQLKALAHLSPYLVVMVLPGSFALLPVLAWWLDRRRLQRDESTPETREKSRP